MMFSSGIANCPICDLAPPATSACTTLGSAGPVYLILVGDGNMPGHDMGFLFDLAAQQEAIILNQAGNKVIACRISSVNDFHTQLTMNGLITGGLMYFGHSGHLRLFDAVLGKVVDASMLAVGHGTGRDTNIGAYNVRQLCDPTAGCNINNYLAPSVTITLVGCRAAAIVADDYAQTLTSIQLLIAKQLNRSVYAWEVSLYASHQDRYHDQIFAAVLGTPDPTPTLPMYMVPNGKPGHKPNPSVCQPNGACSTATTAPY